MIKGKGISRYKEFIESLTFNLNSFELMSITEWQNEALKYVDGLAAEELRRLVDLETRRKYGAFFTKNKLAKKIFDQLKPNFNKQSVIYDPACGAANLLISTHNLFYEKKIRLDNNEHFLGTDVHEEFIEAAKLRCSINQLLLSPVRVKKSVVLNSIFSFSQLDGLLPNDYYNRATHIVVNPPFNQTQPNESINWAKGKVSAAALFIDKIIQNSNPGVSIIAILPDVLRSGSRYEKWRAMIAKECIIEKTKLLGQFDEFADVDVYAIKMTKRKKNILPSMRLIKPAIKKIKYTKTIKDMFDVCVGPVVDNRDEKKGPSHSYVISRGLKGWSIQSQINLNRKHQGKKFNRPFVVIKRTSRMGDSYRAVATIINAPNSVFVDNHLIILQPKSGTLKDCRRVLTILQDSRTNKWLNDKIRCRHLTVKVVLEIPIWEKSIQ